jgi:hypothetical protein
VSCIDGRSEGTVHQEEARHLGAGRVCYLFPRFTWVVTARACSAGLLGLPAGARGSPEGLRYGRHK